MAIGCCDCCFLFRRKRRKEERVKSASAEQLLGFAQAGNEQGIPKLGSDVIEYRPAPLRDSTNNGGDSSEIRGDYSRKGHRESRGLAKVDAEGEVRPSMVTVKETRAVVRSEGLNGKKTVNEYVREGKLATGSYGKVVLHRNKLDNKPYAIKIFHKSRLKKLRVAPNETAMMDVLREVSIMKLLDHPNIVKLIEVIDDPENDHFYMVLEFVEGKCIFEGSGPPGGIGEANAQKYFRDIVSGLMYLHENNIVHRDIKPENLLIAGDGHVKICDFSVSRIFENDNDELRRSPGTPVYTAPECCLGLTYHGRAADVWALGCTLYCMVLGKFPFMGDTLPSTYDKIVNDPLDLPDGMDPNLADLLSGLLDKDPKKRLTLPVISRHPWVVKGSEHDVRLDLRTETRSREPKYTVAVLEPVS